MQTKTMATVLAAIALLGGWAWAGSEETNQPPRALRLELDLVDGSRIIGVPSLESVSVQTPYAKMDVPLAQIAVLAMDDDHETTTLDLLNGDKVKGVLSLSPLSLATVFGNAKIGIEHVRRIRVALSGDNTEGLVLHYALDRAEGGKVTDRSGKGNHGTAHGVAWVAREGRGACSFDGRSSYIETPHSASLNLKKQATIAAWAMLRVIPPWGWHPAVVEKRDAAHASGYALLQSSEATTVKIEFAGANTGTAITPNLPQNIWVHVAGTYDGDKVSIYVNGELSETKDGSRGAIVECNTPLFIGRRSGEPVFLNGCLRDLMIYDRALAAGEIKALYNSQK